MAKFVPFVQTTGTYVELKRSKPHGKLTQDCVRSLSYKGASNPKPVQGCDTGDKPVQGGTYSILSTNERIKPGRKSVASSRSTSNTASKKLSRFVASNGRADYAMTDQIPANMKHGHRSDTSVYHATASNVVPVSQRLQAKGR